MIYYMYAKEGPQYRPQFDFGGGRFEGPISDLDDPETMRTVYIPEDPNQPWMPGLMNCERVPEHQLWRMPKQIYQLGSRPWKKLPDISLMAVTERFHDLIEKFDPGAHQFFPVDIIHKKSKKRYDQQGQFYLWNILPKACPPDVLDYPSLDAKGLLKVTPYGSPGYPYKLYQISTKTSLDQTMLVGRRAGFGQRHIIRCVPCGDRQEIRVEDVHAYGLGPLVTEEFKRAALATGVNTLDFHGIATVDE
jgi:hypothetical protein